MTVFDLMKSLGYEFDPGLSDDHTGFWYDPQKWRDGEWPSVQLVNSGEKQPQHAFQLIEVSDVIERLVKGNYQRVVINTSIRPDFCIVSDDYDQ